MQWKEKLKCNRCKKDLDLSLNSASIVCKNCNKHYYIEQHKISYAIAESYSRDYYYFHDNVTIYNRSFNNPPLDTLEEAYQDTVSIQKNESNPENLLNIVKKYHDSLKMAYRRLLELNPGQLTKIQIDKIKLDRIDNNELGINIKNLFTYLKKAYPNNKLKIDTCFKKNKNMINRIWWVRNKIEHILYTQWTKNSKIFETLNLDPQSDNKEKDILNYNFLVRTNHTVIDIYKLIIELRQTKINKSNMKNIDDFLI